MDELQFWLSVQKVCREHFGDLVARKKAVRADLLQDDSSLSVGCQHLLDEVSDFA